MRITCDSLPAIKWGEPTNFNLQNEVAVFRVQVARTKPYAPQLAAVLAADERQRASRYHRAEDQYRSVIARAALRILVGTYSHRTPAAVRFALGANKKPVALDSPGLHYNVSHSKDWILLALAATEIGVDVEKMDDSFLFQEIVLHSFSPPEQAFMAKSAASRAAFYQLWTRKEAFVKATGQGIDADFSDIPALDGAHDLARPPHHSTKSWSVSTFEAAAGYVAALAYPATIRQDALQFYELDGTTLEQLQQASH